MAKGDRAEAPGIGRIPAVVTHDEQVAVRDLLLRWIAWRGLSRMRDTVVEDIGLFELDVVDEDVAVPELDSIAGHADDPFDERHVTLRRPGLGRVEDHDVAALVRRPPRCQL